MADGVDGCGASPSANTRVADAFKALEEQKKAAPPPPPAQPQPEQQQRAAVDPAQSAAARAGVSAAEKAKAAKLQAAAPDKGQDPTIAPGDLRGVPKSTDIKRPGDIGAKGDPGKKTNDKGGDVKWVQDRLKGLGYDVGKHGADANFGKDTKAAVTQFQKDNGLKQTGRVDAATRNKLFDPNVKVAKGANAAIDKKISDMVGAPAAPPPPTTAADVPDRRLMEEKIFDKVMDATVGAYQRSAVRRDVARSGL